MGLYGFPNVLIGHTFCIKILQVFAIEFVGFAVDFVPFAVEFVAFVVLQLNSALWH